MTVYRLLKLPSNEDQRLELIDTFSNLLKVWKHFSAYATGKGGKVFTYSNFTRLMKGCESNLFTIVDSVFKVERIKVK